MVSCLESTDSSPVVSLQSNLKHSSVALTEKNANMLRSVSENAKVIQEIIDGVLNGTCTIADGCKNAGISYRLFFYYTKKLAQLGPYTTEFHDDITNVFSATERIYAGVFGVHVSEIDQYMPDDAEDALEYVLSLLKPVYATVVREHAEDKTLREISSELGVSPERVRQLEALAYRKMRQPSMICVLKYGIAAIEESRAQLLEEKQKAAAECRRFLRENMPELCQKDVSFDASAGVPLEDMGFSVRAYNCCKRLGIKNSNDFTKLDVYKLARTRGVGDKTLSEITENLLRRGIFLES